jgi:hypothetical protein
MSLKKAFFLIQESLKLMGMTVIINSNRGGKYFRQIGSIFLELEICILLTYKIKREEEFKTDYKGLRTKIQLLLPVQE